MDVFLEKFRKGGVISDPKNYIADFVGFKAVYFGRKFWKKCPKRGGGDLQSKKSHCKFTQVTHRSRAVIKYQQKMASKEV